MRKLKIVFFTGSRAEYGMIRPFIKFFQKDLRFETYLIVSGSHLEKKHGNTISEINKDKIKNVKKIFVESNTNTLNETCKYFNILQRKINNFLNKNKVDLFFLFSDRFETMSVAITAYLNKIPIIHYEGGDKTEGGTLDDNIRHSITKLSHIHLTSNKNSFNRLVKLGEEKWRIINVGYSPFYNLDKKKLLSKEEVIKKFKIDINKKIILFTIHPLPLNIKLTKKEIHETLKTIKLLKEKKFQIIATYPNFDPGYKIILNELEKMKKKKNFTLTPSLGTKNYHSLLNYIGSNKMGICFGNSSGGIKEPIFFNCNSLNIGSRQRNRVKPSNVIDIKKINSKFIYKMIQKSLIYKNKKKPNPYSLEISLKSLKAKIIKIIKKKEFNLKKCTY